jgi:hypothetical protein
MVLENLDNLEKRITISCKRNKCMSITSHYLVKEFSLVTPQCTFRLPVEFF